MSYEPRVGRDSNWIKPMGPIIWSTKITDTLHNIMMEESLRLKKNKENRFNNSLAGNIVDEFSFSPAAQKRCVDELTFLCHNYTMVLKSEGYMMNPWNDGIPEKELQLDKFNFMTKIYKIKKEGHPIIGIGAAAKANTFMNFYKIDNTILDYVTDASEYKKGKYTPLTRVPIVGDEVFADYDEVYALVLSWNISDMLKDKIKQINNKTKFISLKGE